MLVGLDLSAAFHAFLDSLLVVSIPLFVVASLVRTDRPTHQEKERAEKQAEKDHGSEGSKKAHSLRCALRSDVLSHGGHLDSPSPAS